MAVWLGILLHVGLGFPSHIDRIVTERRPSSHVSQTLGGERIHGPPALAVIEPPDSLGHDDSWRDPVPDTDPNTHQGRVEGMRKKGIVRPFGCIRSLPFPSTVESRDCS